MSNLILNHESFSVDFLAHGDAPAVEGSWTKASAHFAVLAPDLEIPSRCALIVLGSSGQILFVDLISHYWESEPKKQHIMSIGATCIANPGHAHWFSFHFEDPEMCDKFHAKFEEALDLVEADHLRHNLRLDMVTDIVRNAEGANLGFVTRVAICAHSTSTASNFEAAGSALPLRIAEFAAVEIEERFLYMIILAGH
ncbi:hypothetical protein VTO73DRAFT_11482 [Trametes versicolor]